MFKAAEKTELNQISLTGIRALIMIGLLIKKPYSLEEIKQTFIDLQIMDKSHSDDIVRIDLNTIKLMGCEIERCSQKTNYKYVLLKHPFAFKIPEDELKVLKRVYNSIKEKASLQILLEYDEMFRMIALHICDEETKESVLGISVFKHYDVEVIKDLMRDCQENNTLDLTYKKAGSVVVERKQILAQELAFNNDKFYLYGFDLQKNEPTVLLVRNIESILTRKFEKLEIKKKQTVIKFVLKSIQADELEKNELIIEQCDNEVVVEGIYHNKFLATQRVLSFGDKCVVLEPLEFRNHIITKIKEMRDVYVCK